MDVLEMKSGDNKEIFDFFKQLNIEDIEKLVVLPQRTSAYHYTEFSFITKNGMKMAFHYAKNEKAREVYVINENDILILYIKKMYQKWIHYIWEQLATHFNLHTRLMFINEKMPWRWELEYIK